MQWFWRLKKIKSVTVSIVSPSICHEVMEPDAMILVFWMLSYKPAFPLSSFTLIKRLFSSSSISAIRVVSSAYLRLLIFLLAILIPAWASIVAASIYIPVNGTWGFLFYPHPCQHLSSVIFLITDILTNVKWYLIVILICIKIYK